jgi:PAS domain S-box-containing protein
MKEYTTTKNNKSNLNPNKEIDFADYPTQEKEFFSSIDEKSPQSDNLARAYFEHLFESAQVGIVILNDNHRVLRCNKEFTSIFGYSKEEAVGRFIYELVVTESQHEDWESVMQTLSLGKNVQHDTVRKRKNGENIDVSILASPIFVNDCRVATYGIYRDITQLKTIEKELMQRSCELEAQNEEYRMLNKELYVTRELALENDRLKTQFLANVSHEFRTPMNGIIGYLQLMAQSEDVHPDHINYIQGIEECSNQLLTTINNLIDISKAESNQIIICRRPVQVNPLLRDLYRHFNTKFKSAGIDFTFTAHNDDDDFEVPIDWQTVKHILVSMLNNAFKFTDKGYVKFGYHYLQECLLFFVKDSGIGISDEHKKTIFNRFHHSYSSFTSKTEGMGLSLAISKELVEKMGGAIGVESEPNKGTTFLFSIPLASN